MKNLLTGEELDKAEIEALIQSALALKHAKECMQPLKGKCLALLFEKPSLRTRFSFTVAMRELGGDVIESLGETRKKEEPEDLARVLAGYCDAIMIRNNLHSDIERMCGTIPIINGLSDLHHPCQILADLMTLQEVFGKLEGLKLAYIGDGNNILHSLILLASKVGIELHYCCPPGRGPHPDILKKGQAYAAPTPSAAVKNAHAVYTDVWTSMGFEEANEELFAGFQVNEALMAEALPSAVFMHCLPMVRGKEVSHTLPDQKNSVIFQQSENRLHIQKAILMEIL